MSIINRQVMMKKYEDGINGINGIEETYSYPSNESVSSYSMRSPIRSSRSSSLRSRRSLSSRSSISSQSRYRGQNFEKQKIINEFLKYLNREHKETEKELYEDDLFDEIKNYKPPRVITENEYFEKMILSKYMDVFNVDNFFSKNKEKFFALLSKERVRRKPNLNKQFRSPVSSEKYAPLKGGSSSLTIRGDDFLKYLHIYDAKHDFSDKAIIIKDYIKNKFKNFNEPSTHLNLPGFKNDYEELFNNSNDYEENILKYVIENIKELVSDISDDNANIMYIDVDLNAIPQNYIYRDDINPAIKSTVNLDYQTLAEVIKTFYNFEDKQKEDIGYLYDTVVKTHSKLDEFVKNLTTKILNLFSTQLYPFENAYDPHSSTDIVFPTPADVVNFKQITDINFNQLKGANKEYLSAIRDITREHLGFNVFELGGIQYLNIEFKHLKIQDIHKLRLKTTHPDVYYYFNLNNIYSQFDAGHTSLECGIHKDIIFHGDNNNLNICYYKSFNSIGLLKECMVAILEDTSTTVDLFINNFFKPAVSTSLNADSSKWLLYMIVLYLTIILSATTPAMNINSIKNRIMDILLDLKKSGDWAQSLFCLEYNRIYKDQKECFFVSGDKLSATRSILNGNVKTITATDYINLSNTKDKNKRCILTLFNSSRKLTFSDLNILIEKSVFETTEAFKFSTFDRTNIIDKFKKNHADNNGTLLKEDNINYDYFWYFMIVIIYQMRIYNNCYSVFRVDYTGADENSLDCVKLPFERQRFEINKGNEGDPNSRAWKEKNVHNYNNFFNTNTKYQIQQLNNAIFNASAIGNIGDLFKIIDEDISGKYNENLDEKYINDITSMFNTIYGLKKPVPNYNMTTKNLYGYLKDIYKTNKDIITASNINIVKFFKKLCNLNKLCQILYIDHYTKHFDNIEKLSRAIDTREQIVVISNEITELALDPDDMDPDNNKEINDKYNEIDKLLIAIKVKPPIRDGINGIKEAETAETEPDTELTKTSNYYTEPAKTILKDIIDIFYDKVCVLIHTLQDISINIGNESYLPSLKMLVKADKLLLTTIHNYTSIEHKLVDIETAVDNLYKPNPFLGATIKDNLILQISNFNKKGIDFFNLDLKIKEVFDDYLNIYKQTIDKYPALNIDSSPIMIPQLKADFLKFQIPDTKAFIKYIQTEFNEKFNMNSKFYIYLKRLINRSKDESNIESMIASSASAIAAPAPQPKPGKKSKTAATATTTSTIAPVSQQVIDNAKKQFNDNKEYKITEKTIPIVFGNKPPLPPGEIMQLNECLAVLENNIAIINLYQPAANPDSITIDDHLKHARTIINNLIKCVEAYDIIIFYYKHPKNLSDLNKNAINPADLKIKEILSLTMSEELFKYFNTEILYYHPSLNIYNPQDADNLKESIKALLMTEKIDDYFKDLHTKDSTKITLGPFHKNILDKIKKYKDKYEIIKANLQYIYKLKPEIITKNFGDITEKAIETLDIPTVFNDYKILFADKLNKLDPENKDNLAFSKKVARERVKPDDVINHHLWYADERTVNSIYRLIVNDEGLKNNLPETDALKLGNQAIIREMFNPKINSNDLNDYFKDLAFIMNLQNVLKSFIDKSYKNLHDISNFIGINKNLTINKFLNEKYIKYNNYYNNDKYKLITVFGKYVSIMGLKKIERLLKNPNKSDDMYGFNNIFKQELLPDPYEKYSTISRTFDIISGLTKSKVKTNTTVTKIEDFRKTFNNYNKIKHEVLELSHQPDIVEYFDYIRDNYIMSDDIKKTINTFIDGGIPPEEPLPVADVIPQGLATVLQSRAVSQAQKPIIEQPPIIVQPIVEQPPPKKKKMYGCIIS